MIQHLLAVAKQMPAGPIGLIGASMGGSVAVVLARELQDTQPQRIEKLLLLAPAGLTGKPMPLPPLLDRLGAGFLGLPAVRRGLCRQAFADPDASVGPAEEEIASLHLSTPGWAAALACFARKAALPGLVRHCLPRRFRCCGAHKTASCEPRKTRRRSLAGGTAALVEGCGHLPHLDQPELVARTWMAP